MVCSAIAVASDRSSFGTPQGTGRPACITKSSICSATGFTTGNTGRGRRFRRNTSSRSELGVSRVTLREALRELVRENLLVKIQGKGTFVASNPPKRLAPVRYTGFLEELQERVRKLRVTDVEIAQVPATAELRKALQLDEATSELTMIRRLRHIDDEPFSFTQNYLPTEIGARIRLKDLYAMPLLKILQEDLKIPIIARAAKRSRRRRRSRYGAAARYSGALSGAAHDARDVHDRRQAVRARRHLLPRRQVSLLGQHDAGETAGPLDMGDRSRDVGVDRSNLS